MERMLPNIFLGMPSSRVVEALRVAQRVELAVGDLLMDEGDQDTSLVVVVEGKLAVWKGGVQVGEVGEGALLGEMALFTGEERRAKVTALTRGSVLVLDALGLKALRRAGNPVAARVEREALQTVASRVRAVGERIGALAEGSAVARCLPSKGFFARVASLLGGGGREQVAVDAAQVLRGSSFFPSVDREVEETVGEVLTGLRCGSGDFLCTEGEEGEAMYVIASGQVDVLIETRDDRVEPIARLGPGEVFGTVALIQRQPRMASCVARGEVVVLELDRARWEELDQSGSKAASWLRRSLIRGLSEQLDYANAQLAEHVGGRGAPLSRASAGVTAHGRFLEGRA
ncbi:MAG: cyclic nucleotide-binding domain-containing protein [Deltaproteobacteria bacterium]|nr:cyclic nucleotide-binding domain-containing protein [Deltaproteobacteria bacterium]